jgi:hypothetical protein
MALIQGMENANKTRVRFRWCVNGGFLEGAISGLAEAASVWTAPYSRRWSDTQIEHTLATVLRARLTFSRMSVGNLSR